MFDQMMSLVKDQVKKSIGGMDGIPADKQSAVVETTASSLISGLKNYATPDKLSSLLGGGGSGGSMASGLTSGVVSALTSKVGLNSGLAQTIAGAVIPAVMSLFKKNVGDTSKPGFNLQSMASALGGVVSGGSGAGASSGGGLGSMLGGLGNLLGKK